MGPYVKTSRNADSESFLSVAGRSGRYNSIQIDGAVNNDLFGLARQGTPGGQANTQPISLDAVSELQLVVAPYDVRQSGFSPAVAWGYPLLEWARTGTAHLALVYDIDSREALEELAAASMSASASVPTPNIAIYRKKTQRAHAVYTRGAPSSEARTPAPARSPC